MKKNTVFILASLVAMFISEPAFGSWIGGSAHIWDKAVELGAVPGEPVPLGNHKSSTPFVTESFYTWNFRNDGFDSISATCWVKGEHCYVFLSERINPVTLQPSPEQWCQDYADTFDSLVYPSVTGWLGEERHPPDPLDVDGDDRIVILLDDVQDDYSSEGMFYEGYFCFGDQYANNPAGTTFEACSNERDMMVIDAKELYNQGKNYGMHDTMAHMLAHLCMFDNDREEKYWIEEGLCCLAEHFPAGQSPVGKKTNDFRAKPDNCLLKWNNEPGDYGNAFFFMRYLMQQFGEDHPHFFKTLVEAKIPSSSTPYRGIAGLEYVLDQEDCSVTLFRTLFHNYTIALFANEPELAPEYCVGPRDEIDAFTAADANVYHGVISTRNLAVRNYGITPLYFMNDKVEDFAFNIRVEDGLDPFTSFVSGRYAAKSVHEMVFDGENEGFFSISDVTDDTDYRWTYVLVTLQDDSVTEIAGDRSNLYDDSELLRSFSISATTPNYGALCTCKSSSAAMGLLPGLLALTGLFSLRKSKQRV